MIKGYVFNDEVRADRCVNCKSTTIALTANHHNPNLLLYGCKDSKCKHRMLRLDFNAEVSKKAMIQTMTPHALCYQELAPQISS